MRILGFVLFVVLIGFSLGSSFPIFLDSPSAILCVGLLVSILLSGFGSGIGAACRSVFRHDVDRQILSQGLLVLERAKSAAVGGGTLGTLLGLVIILKNLDDPKDLAPGFAVALLTSLYALFLAYGVLGVLAAGVRRKLAGTPA